MEYITYSDIGKRKRNEDVVLVKELHPNNLLAIIADGMGGYEHGDNAAELIVSNVVTYLGSLKRDSYSKGDIGNALKKANLALKQFNEDQNVKSGATVAAAILGQISTVFFWIGDVQIDLFKENELIYKSESHTLIQELKKQIEVVSIEMIQKFNHIVTKSISGKREIIDFGYQEFSNDDFDKLIISTDGVHNCVATSQLIQQDLLDVNCFLKKHADDNNSYILIHNF